MNLGDIIEIIEVELPAELPQGEPAAEPAEEPLEVGATGDHR